VSTGLPAEARVDTIATRHISAQPRLCRQSLFDAVNAAYRKHLSQLVQDRHGTYCPRSMGLLDRYEIVRLLGRGGAGQVFLARDRLQGGREVALKRIAARVGDVVRAAFEREFAMLATLRIAGVAPVYDFGVRSETPAVLEPFFTRAYIAGRPLDEAIHDADLSARVDLFDHACAIIAPLHRVGVVHGDLKPGNIIVDAQRAPWLIDFGLSRTRLYEQSRETAGLRAGTPAFMAPELLRGEAPSVAADIYALGVTLWWLATGHLPFVEPDARTAGRRLERTLARIPDAADAQLRAVLTVATRALSPEPGDRFPCIEELQAALTRTLPGLGAPREQAFVPPRPRGHEATLDQLDALLSDVDSVLLSAAHGGGKSLLLCELKWRKQLAAHWVIELSAGLGMSAAPLLSLFEQLEIILGPDHPASLAAARALVPLRDNGQLIEPALVDALAESLQAVAAQVPLLLSVDDLDRAEAWFGAMLRSAVHAHPTLPIALVATATDLRAPSVKELQADRSIELPRLDTRDSRVLCSEALGPLDDSVVAALIDYADGLPGALMSALYQLSGLPSATSADVAQLPAAEATLALTRARTAQLPQASLQLLYALTLVSDLPVAMANELDAALDVRERETLIARGLLVQRSDQLSLADAALRRTLTTELGSTGRKQLAELLLAAPSSHTLSLTDRASLAAIAEQSARMREWIPDAVQLLSRQGAHTRAAELLTSLLSHEQDDAHYAQTAYALASAQQRLGQDASCAELALTAADRAPDPALRTSAQLLRARALTALGRWDDAALALEQVGDNASPEQRAQVHQQLAKIQLRRGDYAAVARAVECGLACASDAAPVRVELLCSQGIVASYAGDQPAARSCYERALQLARARGARAEQADVLSYMAIACQRSGDMLQARQLLTEAIEVARELGDVGSMARSALNLGAVLYYLGELAAAAEHYETAARLSRRAGRSSTRLVARANLAHLHVYFGLYESAASELEQLFADATLAQQRATLAQLTALAAELSARRADVERALVQYQDALQRYAELGRTRELIEHNLDAADLLFDRAGPSDASAAAAYLARAREHLARERIEDLGLRLELSVARGRLLSGEPEAAAQTLDDIAARAQSAQYRDIAWSALAALALAHERSGSLFAEKRSARGAVEILEDIALRVPREHRDAFWGDPRRRAIRERADRHDHSTFVTETTAATGGAQERERLFQILRRLASERDLPRLLERIIESAVDLSGAEHGSVLLLDERGQLAPHADHARLHRSDEAHARFSRSIAEAVLIDGEPIVTVDAASDGRLQSYVSVNKLMLRSVACLPIRSPTGTLGVLYLEHRRSRGRFTDESVELLCAFADQAAIALENARLLDEIRTQKSELEDKNRELMQAKRQLEDTLLARTAQLEETQRELLHATQRSDAPRHGMIGTSPQMQRLFDSIDRLASSNVGVVICGETGTGKELVARAIHRSSSRAHGPFVAIDCGSLPETLLESELFGYVKGAFSGAERDRLGLLASAHSGTLFLDEVSEMSPRMQVSLLRVLQERKVQRLGSDVEESIDLRLLAATRTPLRELVQRGQFREDLLYRLSVVELCVPPLRERREDIPVLCDHLLRELASHEAIPTRHLTRAALAALMAHAWPGNVRQLRHVLLQASVLVDGTTIDASDLDFGDSAQPSASLDVTLASKPLVENLSHHKREEKQRILHALEASGWNRVKAAQALGMPRRTFYRRLSDYSII